jgi:hypothetical protein
MVDQQTFLDRQDSDHLKLLTIFHRIYGILHFAVAFVGLVYIILGADAYQESRQGPRIIVSWNQSNTDQFGVPEPSFRQARPPRVGIAFMLIGAFTFLSSFAVGAASLFAAIWFQDRRNWVGAIVVSVINCFNVPIGTILGVFALVVLMRVTVKALFYPDKPTTIVTPHGR